MWLLSSSCASSDDDGGGGGTVDARPDGGGGGLPDGPPPTADARPIADARPLPDGYMLPDGMFGFGDGGFGAACASNDDCTNAAECCVPFFNFCVEGERDPALGYCSFM
jgi:hypothetical protein